jgi:phthalate 4,5-cis-dihydrodiol dehydrogenase
MSEEGIMVANPENNQPKLRMGVIGLGGAARQMIPAFAKHPHMEITAAADVDLDALDRFQRDYAVETYTSAEEMCKSSKVDAVYIATPNQFHTEHVMAALSQRKHVLCEKPMTLTLEESDEMITEAERVGVQLGVNVKHSFEPRIRKLLEIVRSGELGPLRMLHSWHYNDWLYRPRTPEEMNPDLGGGVPWRQGPHQFDIIRTIGGGLVRSVRATTGFWDNNRPVAGSHTAFIEFENGAVATAVYSGYDHFRTADLMPGSGEDGFITDPSQYGRSRRALRDAESPQAEQEAKRAARYGGARTVTAVTPSEPRQRGGEGAGGWVMGGPMIVSFDRGDVRLSPNGLLVYTENGAKEVKVDTRLDGHHGSTASFYDGVVNDRPPQADGRWGKATLELILAVFQSGKERKEIFLSHQRPTAP